jgi:hypothetical protein
MTDNIIFQCDTNIDCIEDKQTVEIINGEAVIVKENGDVFSLNPCQVFPQTNIVMPTK